MSTQNQDQDTKQQGGRLVQSQHAGAQAPVVVDNDDGVMAQWGRDVPVAYTNLDQSGPEGRALITQALATADIKTRNAVGQVLKVVGYIAHAAEVVNRETGEIVPKVRIVLVLHDGRTLSTMSEPCVRAIRYLAKACPNKRWDPPLNIEIREHPLEGGHSYCTLREVAAPAEEKKKK